MRTSAGRFGVLAEREFRLVFLAGAVSQVGDQMMPVAIAFAVLDLTNSPADLGYVLAAGTAPLVALLLAGGVFADRVARRHLMIAKRSLRGAGAWSLILAVFAAGTLLGGVLSLRNRTRRPLVVATIWNAALAAPIILLALRLDAIVIAAGAFVAGLGLAVFGTLWSTTMQREIPREALSRVSAYDWFGSIATLPIGFALAGVVSGAIGVATVLWIGAATVLVSTVVILAVPDVWRVR